MEKSRVYYTLEELQEHYDEVSTEFDMGIVQASPSSSNNTYLHYLVDLVFDGTTSKDDLILFTQDYANILYCRYIYPRFKTAFVGFIDDEEEATTAIYQAFMRYFIYILNSTYDKYKVVLDSFATQKTLLLNQIKNTSEVIYQDTPQNSLGTYDEDHTSTRTKTTGASDGGTPAQRLKDIEDNINNYYVEWSNEFRRIFIYE